MRWSKYSFILAGSLLVTGLAGCQSSVLTDSEQKSSEAEASVDSDTSVKSILSKEDITVENSYDNSNDGEHAIEVDGEEVEYSNISVSKSGDSEGDESDFYGENATVFATNKATLTIKEAVIQSNGTHANGVFSYGEGTTINISDSVIETTGNCSGGLMTTGGGTMNASNLTIHTTGNSSAAIRSDRGGGTVTVDGGSYTTDGTGSPVIYSTAAITVNDSSLESTASEGVVVEGKNSVTLNNCDLIADNNTKNSDKSDNYNAVMIYQSMSGDAAAGTASFTMNGGTLKNKNGDVFFVNNTACDINLSNADIVNEDGSGVLLRAAAAGWGNEGSNGGKVNLTAQGQTISGNMVVDEVSVLNLYLKEDSSWTGAINTDGQKGDVYVELDDGSTWTLTSDSYVSSLTCEEGSINLNGHKLYVDGKEYEEGTAVSGEAIEIVSENGDDSQMTPPDGNGPMGDGSTPPEKPDGNGPMGDGSMPPEKPDGNGPMGDGSTPPEKPDESNTSSPK
ncbi:MAG: hypothetical protein K6G76_00445 [Lachnospiraceae bacterium]|nr:hypothetical protein [Lachnospiraceae bacterium]